MGNRFQVQTDNANAAKRSFLRHPVALALSAVLATLSVSAAAQVANGEVSDKDDVQKVSEVTVVGTTATSAGETVVSESTLNLLPSATGTVTDALRGQSFINFDRYARTNRNGAEIESPKISIRGSRYWENNYTINGLSNNNTLSPGSWAGDTGNQSFGVPPTGDVQSYMVDTSMLNAVEVLSENVSAQYGEFTGGMVNAKLRDANTDAWHGKVWARHTRDSWTRQMVVEGDDPADLPQNEFKHYHGGFTIDGPLFDGKLGAMIGYTRHESRMPVVTAIDEKHTGTRTNENLIVKVNTDPKDDFYVTATAMYAPYAGEYFAPVNRNGRYEVDGGGWNFLVNTRARTGLGEWTNDVSYGFTEVTLDADANKMYAWDTKPGGKPSRYANWTHRKTANEGLMGDHEKTQYTFDWRSVMNVHPIELSIGTQHIRFGGEIKHQRAHGKQEGYQSYISAQYDPNVKGELANGVIAGEQYLEQMREQDAYERSISVVTSSAFFEDTMNIGRVTLRPGLRLSWDNITEEANWAPRLFADIDLLNNDRVHVNGGFNRYFGTQIINYALATPMAGLRDRYFFVNDKHEVEEWIDPNAPQPRVVSMKELGELKTPYSDEFTLGASATLFGDTLLKVQGVKRDYRNQLRTKMDIKQRPMTYKMTNDGESTYKGVTLTLESSYNLGAWGSHRSSFGVTRSQMKGNSSNWFSDWSKNDMTDPDFVYIDGVLTPKTDMPADNFNPDWTITFTQESAFMHDRLRTMLLARWESAADHLYSDGHQGKYAKYVTVRQKPMINVDMNTQFDLVKMGDTKVTLDVDVMNVFNHTTNVLGSNPGSSVLTSGRQFYVGVSAEF